MATKEGEAPIHVNVPKSWVEDIDWAIRHENEKSGKFPKMTRTDAVKNAISRIAEDARRLRKEEEMAAVAKANDLTFDEQKRRIAALEEETRRLCSGKQTRETALRLKEIEAEAVAITQAVIVAAPAPKTKARNKK